MSTNSVFSQQNITKILAISFYVTGFGIRNSYLESLAAMAILGASVEKWNRIKIWKIAILRNYEYFHNDMEQWHTKYRHNALFHENIEI